MFNAIILTKESISWLRDKRIYFSADGSERLRPGEHLIFPVDASIEPYVSFRKSNVLCSMGSFSFSNSDMYAAPIEIGRYSLVSINLKIPGYRHPVEYLSQSHFTHGNSLNYPSQAFLDDRGIEDWTYYPSLQKPLPIVEHDVWIGQDVVLNRGVRVSTGAVIAANSVVTRSVGPYEIVGGNPARLIRKRFDDECVSLLLETEWCYFDFTGGYS